MSSWRREGCRLTASPDLNTLFSASASLFATMANKINERGQVSGMAIVLSGRSAIRQMSRQVGHKGSRSPWTSRIGPWQRADEFGDCGALPAQSQPWNESS